MTKEFAFSELQQEPQSGLYYRRLISTEAPRARLLLLHGVGGNESNLAGLSTFMPSGLEVMVLRAPLQIAPEGFAWFQVSFTGTGPVINEEQAESSRTQLLQFIQSQPQLPTVIAGFSQGGILSSSVGLSAPHCVAGFGLLSGRILPELEPHIAAPEALRSLSAFVAHGHEDNKLPVSWAQKADVWLTQLGVPHQTRFYDMGHETTTEEVDDFIQWLRSLLNIA